MTKKAKKIALWAAVLALTAGVLVLPAAAAPRLDPTTPVIDDAGILSRDTENYITDISTALQNTCGAQIGVYTTEYIGNSTMEGFAYEVFNDWGLGSASADNGVLLLLAPGEDDYFIMRGVGLESQLTLSSLQTLLDKNLEDAWVAQDYDTGTCQTVEALADKLCKIYGVSLSVDGYVSEPAPRSNGISFGSIVVLVLVLLIVVLALVSTMLRPRVVYARPRWFWAPRPPRPPRPPRHSYGPPPGYGAPPRPPRPPRSGSRSSGVGRSSGAARRPSGGSFRAGGGSSRGGGVGRRH